MNGRKITCPETDDGVFFGKECYDDFACLSSRERLPTVNIANLDDRIGGKMPTLFFFTFVTEIAAFGCAIALTDSGYAASDQFCSQGRGQWLGNDKGFINL